MPRVLVNTQNFMFADMIKRTLEAGDFSVTVVDRPEKLIGEFNRTAANIVLLEVTGRDPWRIDERIELLHRMKKTDPECKTVFLVDEKAEPQAAKSVRQAKIDGLIEQFVYASVSAEYLAGIIETL